MAAIDDALVPAAFARDLAGRPAPPPGPHGRGMSGDDWLRALPGLVRDAVDAWELRLDGPARHGVCALVVPVRRRDGTPAALKVTWPHAEAAHEHLALRAWAGAGAVRLLAADPAHHVLLLERVDADADLSLLDEEGACTVVGELLRTLDRPALPRLTRLSTLVDGWLAGPLASPPPGLPRRFVEQARAAARDLAGDTGTIDARLVHTDLHDGNVLRALSGVDDRAEGEWVAIDPKPLAADPAFAVWPVLHNRWDEAGHDVPTIAWTTRCRLGWVCEAAGLDEDRARAWAIVRTVVDTADLLADGGGTDATSLVTDRITLLKALQPGA